ncbi:unnamed protein product [Clonostachys rhizophaga]|uniref:Uncharacterized protein n=1 Tax=Clonostachys rhizophaga TaxID=160324 RepID=A0A9N9YQ78_9HYPO|nr:unnamed protein product [Clonostachys rhizophaga]
MPDTDGLVPSSLRALSQQVKAFLVALHGCRNPDPARHPWLNDKTFKETVRKPKDRIDKLETSNTVLEKSNAALQLRVNILEQAGRKAAPPLKTCRPLLGQHLFHQSEQRDILAHVGNA